jgi:hypothetical protein
MFFSLPRVPNTQKEEETKRGSGGGGGAGAAGLRGVLLDLHQSKALLHQIYISALSPLLALKASTTPCSVDVATTPPPLPHTRTHIHVRSCTRETRTSTRLRGFVDHVSLAGHHSFVDLYQ